MTRISCTVMGEGLLAGAITAALSAHAVVAAEPRVGHTMLVTATDGWNVTLVRARRTAAGRVLPWLPVRTELGRVVIGPLELAGTPGCGRCMELRRGRARAEPALLDAVSARYGDVLAERASLWLTTVAGDSVAALVAAEFRRLVAAQTPLTHCAVLYVDLADLTVSRHRFLPEPLCSRCGDLPADDRHFAEITLLPRPKPAPGTYRLRPVLDELDHVRETYVDPETGLISTITRDTQAGLVLAAALMRLRSSGGRTEAGIGRSRSYRSSEVIGILEALERYGGVEPGGKRTSVRASFRELADRAVDPRTLGVHPAESYASEGFPYRPFREDAVCTWVWGYSFGRRETVLVPEAVAYYHTRPRAPEERPFVYEISNGCALGNCLEEAILYGLLEVAERDAFLMTWYGRLPVPRLDLDSASDRAIPLHAAAIAAQTGYRPMVFDTTMEHGVPSVWAVATKEDGTAAGPALACAAGSHLVMERAVLNALSELGPIVHDLVRRYPDEAHRAYQMAGDPFQVVTMQDHSLLYAVPEAARRLDFLLQSPAERRLGLGAQQGFSHADLSEDLRAVVRRFLDSGLDVIVIDQTTPEHRAGGFACVKVLVPGSVPMTFGFRNRRLDGIPRLRLVPQLLGYQPRPLHPDELNQHPHPFP